MSSNEPSVRQLKQVQRRLPLEQILELVRQFESGASASELAKTFGINQSTVHAHLKRQGAKPRPYRKLWGERLEEAIRLHESGCRSVELLGSWGSIVERLLPCSRNLSKALDLRLGQHLQIWLSARNERAMTR